MEIIFPYTRLDELRNSIALSVFPSSINPAVPYFPAHQRLRKFRRDCRLYTIPPTFFARFHGRRSDLPPSFLPSRRNGSRCRFRAHGYKILPAIYCHCYSSWYRGRAIDHLGRLRIILSVRLYSTWYRWHGTVRFYSFLPCVCYQWKNSL